MWNTELLCRQCRGIRPHLTVKGKSHGFSRVAAATWGFLSSYDGDGPSKFVLVHRCQDSCLVARDHSIFSSRPDRSIGTPLMVRWEIHCPFPVATVILEFLSIFERRQASSQVDTCNSAFLLRFQTGVQPPVVMRWGTRALTLVSTGDSDIPSCCERKHRLAFESLQGNQALPRGRGTRCPFHLRPQTQGPCHIHIAKRSLPLRCLWKVGISLELKPGNQLSSRDDLGYTEHFSSC